MNQPMLYMPLQNTPIVPVLPTQAPAPVVPTLVATAQQSLDLTSLMNTIMPMMSLVMVMGIMMPMMKGFSQGIGK